MNITSELKEFAIKGLKHPNIQQYLRENNEIWSEIKDNIKSSSTHAGEKLWIIANGVSKTKCKICDNETSWNRKKREYQKYCSSNCSNKDIDVKNKIKQTNLEKYGVERPMQNKEIFNKTRETMLKNHGVSFPTQSKEIQDKIKQTNLEKYGVERAAQSEEILEKTRKTNIEKYGSEYPSQNNNIRNKQIKTLNKRYNVSVPMHSEIIKNKVKETQQKTVKNIGKYPSQYHISKYILELLNSKELLIKYHIIQKYSITKIANILNVNHETVRKRFIEFNIPIKHFFISSGENEIIHFFNNLNLEYEQTNRTLIPPYELDILLPEHNLAIEYCGLYWHSEQAGKNKHYHKRKHDLCQKKGIQLITIFEDEWIKRQKQVKSKLLSLLNKDTRPKIYARKTEIVNVSKETKSTFFNENHIQGNGPSSINIGLIYNDELVACMGFIQHKNKTYLNRYATSALVIGGFSKLLKYFQQNYIWENLISFADLRWSNGNLYEKTGWSLDKILPPDYYYSPNGIDKYHKFNFRHKNLYNKLKNYNSNLSEKENCDNNKIYRIWDCGKIRYVKYNIQ